MNEPIATPSSRLGANTVARILEAMESGACPAIAQIVQLLQDITANADTISVSQLADVVSRDLSILARVLTVANTIGYNPTASHVTTVHEAIQTIGFERIRNIAIASMLVESAERAGSGAEKQHVAAHALACGAIAQVLAEKRGGLNADEAFVCAALRNYGELLVTQFLPEEYHRAKTRASAVGWDASCREVLGLSLLDIGRQILVHSNLPKPLIASMREASPDILRNSRPTEGDLMVAICDFSSELCRQLSAGNGTDAKGSLADAALSNADRYGASLSGLGREDYEGIALNVSRRIASLTRGTGVIQHPLLHKLAGAAEPNHDPGASNPLRTPVTRPAARTADQKLSALGESLIADCPSLRGALTRTMGLLREELALVQCVTFLKDDVLPTWSAREGYGELFQLIQSQPLLSPEARNVFSICLSRGEDVLIESPSEPSIRRYVPEWLLDHVRNRSLLLLSLTDSQGTFGIICGIGESQRSLRLTSQLAQPIKELKAALARLNKRRLAA